MTNTNAVILRLTLAGRPAWSFYLQQTSSRRVIRMPSLRPPLRGVAALPRR
jgi:hypothetical protein